MKKTILLLLIINLGCQLFAQDLMYQDYKWKAIPDKNILSEKDKLDNEIMLFEKKSIQYYVEDEILVQANFLHTIKIVNTDKGIEKNNKVYIANSATSVVYQKARVIKPNGKIIELKESDILDKKNDEGEVEYRYFALEGLEKGSVIEYMHLFKQNASMSGATMYIQSSEKKYKVECEILTPKHLDFQIFSVNGCPEFKLDTTSLKDKEIRRKFLNIDMLAALPDEDYAPTDKIRQKAYYKFQKNFVTGKSNFYTYTDAANNIYESMFVDPSKTALKKIKAIIKEIEAKGATSEEDKLRALELYVKTTFGVIDVNNSQLSDLDFIFDKKVANKDGLTKLMLATAKRMDVKLELILTSDKNDRPFEESYEDYAFLNDYLIYFNTVDKYWSPNLGARLGFVPYDFAETKGLFIKEEIVGGIKAPISKVKEIKGLAAKDSKDIIHAKINFVTNSINPSIEIERIVNGYKSEYLQNYLFLMNDEQKKDALEEFMKYIDEAATISNTSFKNTELEASGKLPLIGKANYTSDNFIEKAGANTLFKIGLIIGPQMEMYNEKPRELPYFAHFPRTYIRTIEVNLPASMKVVNLDDLKINLVSADKKSSFVSTYELVGDKLKVLVTETYEKSTYQAIEFEEYQKVMNGAADFNKVVLVLEPK